MSRRRSAIGVALLLGSWGTALAGTPVYSYTVIAEYPHDPMAFTEGLLYHDGDLYESTGLNGLSSVRRVDLETGRVLQRSRLPARYFGEGLALWEDTLVQLTYTTEVGFLYDRETFAPLGEFDYPGEGWGLTRDGERLIMSDGSSSLRFLDPDTLEEQGRLEVHEDGQPVANLNELEYINGLVYANVWLTDWIVMIAPDTGEVVGRIDLTGLLPEEDQVAWSDVLNGIAYDAEGDRLFVTGKFWTKLFEIGLEPTALESILD